MRYAHRDDVLSQVGLDPVNPEDATDILRIERLENGLADAFDQKVGHSFGTAPLPRTRTVPGGGTDVLPLGYPGARAIESITAGGWWDGLVWRDETLLLPGDWEQQEGGTGITVVRALHGVWSGPVRVTAIWADQPLEGVPDDVREAMTFLTVDEYRTRNASPAGFVGPDGLMVPARNPWRFEFVKAAIARHRVKRARVGV